MKLYQGHLTNRTWLIVVCGGLIMGLALGVQYIATLFGLSSSDYQLGAFFGVWLGGYVFDMTPSYDLIWFVSIALGFVVALLYYLIDDREIGRIVPAAA